MARSFTQSLLAAAVAFVVGGSALAQGTLKDAVLKLRLGKDAEAKELLRGILQADPSNEAALEMYKSVSQDEYFMMLTGSDEEIRKIAQSILERAKAERGVRSRDDAAIRALVDTATSSSADHGARQKAVNTLVMQHGEFAVPALVEKLANADDVDGNIHAIYTLKQLGSVAVVPLIEVLQSSKEILVQNAAAALRQIGDTRAAGAMAHLATDSREGVSRIAKAFLADKGITGRDVDLLLSEGRRYLRGVLPYAGSDVVWTLTDDKLVATDVNPLLYSVELAKASAAAALRIEPTNPDATSLLAQANLAQSNLIQTSIAQGDEAMKPLEPVAAELKIAALATGLPALRAALDAGVQQGLTAVAMGAIDALATAETADTVGQSSLVRALDSTDKRVKYAAAEALVRATGGIKMPSVDRVVAVLAEAVAEQSVRTIHLIDPSHDPKGHDLAKDAGGLSNMAVAADASAVAGMGSLLNNPNVDVVVINQILPDALPEDVIGNIKKDPRMANTKIVIVAKDVEAAKAWFKDTIHGVLQAPLNNADLVAEVNRVLEGSANPSGVRAEAYAKGASEALLAVAANKLAIDGALDSLQKQLGRSDAVAVPAARSLGLAGTNGQLDPLVAAMQGGASVEVKKAAAEAIGSILLRSAEACPAPVVDALVAVVSSGAEVVVRTAAAGALGSAKLDAAKSAEIFQKLRKVAGAPKTEG